MKVNKILSLFVGASLMTMFSCEPIEDRDVLTNSFDPDAIELEVIQSTAGGNGLSIRMNTPGVTGYWDFVIDTKYSDRVEVNFPIPGKHTFTYHVTTPYMPNGKPSETEYVAKTIDVQIDQLDQPLPEAYYNLVGSDLGGKTWVFNKDHDWFDGQKVFWAMVAGYNWKELWWNAGSTCCPPGDADGKMVFDLNGAANYTYYNTPDATGALGSFAFNSDYSSLTFKNQPILGYDEARVNPDSKYQIISLTEDELILYTSTNAGGTGWIWVFKPAE